MRALDVAINTACLGVMDLGTVAGVWEDLLYHGDVHGHADGGLMTYDGAIGTHLEHDGSFPLKVAVASDGSAAYLSINLDPYGDDLEGLREPILDHSHSHDHDHDHGDESHGHGHSVDGWTAPLTTYLPTGSVLVGDPAEFVEAGHGALARVDFSGPGYLTTSVYQEGRVRRFLVAAFRSA